MALRNVRLNSPGMRDLLSSPGVRADLRRRAAAVEAAAKASAPVDTGAYRASIHVEDATTDRAVVRVVSGDAKAFVIESRTGNLARALDAAGGS